MTPKVSVLSRETIKPSLPTPPHLRTFRLSLLDQYSFPVRVPVILFYFNYGENDHTKISKLKTSLSDILTHFYPLAGRIVGDRLINCDDSGVQYLEAQANTQLETFLKYPKADELNQLLPLKLHHNDESSETQLQIQVNTFECGGIAIAASISHMVADTATLCSFINTWAAKSCGCSKTMPPCFDSVALFPPKEIPSFQLPMGDQTQRVISKRFVFHSAKLAALRAKSVSKLEVENPTRVEVVSALVWKCLMNAATRRQGMSFTVNMAVNLRSRMVPPLSDNSFGNLIIGALPSAERGEALHCLVGKFRKMIKRDYSKLLENNGISIFHDGLRKTMEAAARGKIGMYTITSWCRFPFYEADFGWGKPIWATTVNVDHKNIVMLMDTKDGDGIEALVTLDERDMALFECQQELLDFAIPNSMVS